MTNLTFRRGQAEWALWQLFRLGGSLADPAPPQAFKARIKKLLDLDRLYAEGATPLAFSPELPGRMGVDLAFTGFDVFCLGLALELLSAGFLQVDAVSAVRQLRPELEGEHAYIISHYPSVTRARRLAANHPRLPSYEDKGNAIADTNVYLIIRRVELHEALPALKPRKDVTLTSPRVAYGRNELSREMMRLSPYARSLIVIEIGAVAKLLEGFLARAPQITRGRKS